MRPLVTEKHPSTRLTYEVDYGEAYEELLAADPIASGTVVSNTAGLSIGAVSVSGTKLLCTISGGTSGTTYRLTWTATTTAGLTLAETLDMAVKTPSSLRRPSSVEALT